MRTLKLVMFSMSFMSIGTVVRLWTVFKSMKKTEALCLSDSYLDHPLTSRPICPVDAHYDVVIIINSVYDHFSRREAIRETWGNETYYQSRTYRVKRLFMVGNPTNREMHNQLVEENIIHNDIVFVNIEETYRNIVYKHIYILHAVAKDCSNVNLVMKTDDDVFVDVIGVYHDVIENEDKKKSLWCSQGPTWPIRDSWSKWFIDFRVYNSTYPPYCAGAFYTLNITSVRALSQAGYCTPHFWVDDVFVTGLVRVIAKIPFKGMTADDVVFFPVSKFGVNFTEKFPIGMKMIYADQITEALQHRLWNILMKKIGL